MDSQRCSRCSRLYHLQTGKLLRENNINLLTYRCIWFCFWNLMTKNWKQYCDAFSIGLSDLPSDSDSSTTLPDLTSSQRFSYWWNQSWAILLVFFNCYSPNTTILLTFRYVVQRRLCKWLSKVCWKQNTYIFNLKNLKISIFLFNFLNLEIYLEQL